MNNRRKTLQKLAGIGTVATVVPNSWVKPVVSSIILPTHAQTSCSSITDIDILGKWLFTDSVGNTIEIEFISETPVSGFSAVFSQGTLSIDNQALIRSWDRLFDGGLILGVNAIRAPWQGSVTRENNCIATEITLTDVRDFGIFKNAPFTTPLVGARV